MRSRAALAAASLGLLACACATDRHGSASTLPLQALPGWEQEDHTAAVKAVAGACAVASREPGPHCSAAAPPAGQERRWLARWFRAEPVTGEGLLTAYFAPVYPARPSRGASFTAPVRPASDLQALASKAPTRTNIEASPAPAALAWMRPEDLFFLQIQGSGVLIMPDGRRLRAAFASHNGQPFVGLAKLMRERGLLADHATSSEAIRAWLAANRGARADALMRQNPRYVFFSVSPDDGLEPKGAAGVALPPGRSVAVDPAHHRFGDLLWIEADTPALSGARAKYRRLTAALDTGGAIKGPVRADLYLGTGEAAGREAGAVRHRLRLYRLVPVRR